MKLAAAIQQLHDRCAIYTSPATAARLLDVVGWTSAKDLSQSVLLEPCAGEGVILLEGARRLIASQRTSGRAITSAELGPRIRGFELHGGSARSAKLKLRRLLLDAGVEWIDASKLADTWINQRDFLLQPPLRATHVAANPPYVRWAKLPTMLATHYREMLPSAATRGDLSVAFLHRMQEWASDEGSIAALVSDRWMYAQYADEFVRETEARGWSIEVVDERPMQPFDRRVGAYSAIVLLTKNDKLQSLIPLSDRAKAKALHRSLATRHGTLGGAGCSVRVGPALGAGKTYIVDANRTIDVEQDLLRPFADKSDLTGDELSPPKRRVLVPYDREGGLIDLTDWPRFARWAEAHRDRLATRSQFRGRQDYWRTIDAVPNQWSKTPKLLLPELCKKPTITIDRTDSIPAHSIYAIWTSEWPIEVLKKVLDGGLLELTASAEAPRLGLGWVRFYKRFLMRTPLPKWSSLSERHQRELSGTGAEFDDAFEQLFDFRPGLPPIT